MNCLRLRRAHDRGGFVSVLVLILVLTLAILLLEFSHRGQFELGATDNARRSQQALRGADAGIACAISAIRADPGLNRDEVRNLFDGEAEIVVGNSRCVVRVTPENGRLNVNRLVENGAIVRPRVAQFLRLIDVLNAHHRDGAPFGYGIVPAAIDWVDPDDNPTVLSFVGRENTGAEASFYRKQDPPRVCRNAPFDTLDELLRLRGMTPEFLNGGDETAGLRDVLTVYGDGRIDINAAPAAVIFSLSENMNARLVEAILERRKTQRFVSLQDLALTPGMTLKTIEDLRDLMTFGPAAEYYRVAALGIAGDVQRRVEVVLRRDGGGRVGIVQRIEF